MAIRRPSLLHPSTIQIPAIQVRSFFLRSAALLCLGATVACAPANSQLSGEAPPPGVQDAGDRPRLANRGAAVLGMREAYPPLLRDAGVSGETTATFLVLPDGSVSRGSIRVERVSAEDFRAPTRQVVARLRFAPSERGQRAAVRATLRWMLPQPDVIVASGL